MALKYKENHEVHALNLKEFCSEVSYKDWKYLTTA